MKAGVVTVDQTVDERISGMMIGNYTASFQGGKITIRQKADVVDGVLTGGFCGTVGWGAAKEVGQAEVLAQLQELLRMEAPKKLAEPALSGVTKTRQFKETDMTCPNCHTPVQPDWKFCSNCRAPLPAPAKFCMHCEHEIALGAIFCLSCGKSVSG
jgi:hypothetical protein